MVLIWEGTGKRLRFNPCSKGSSSRHSSLGICKIFEPTRKWVIPPFSSDDTKITSARDFET